MGYGGSGTRGVCGTRLALPEKTSTATSKLGVVLTIPSFEADDEDRCKPRAPIEAVTLVTSGGSRTRPRGIFRGSWDLFTIVRGVARRARCGQTSRASDRTVRIAQGARRPRR